MCAMCSMIQASINLPRYNSHSKSSSAVPVLRRSPDRHDNYYVRAMIMNNAICVPSHDPNSGSFGISRGIRLCGIFPLDRGIAGVHAISRDFPGFTGMVEKYGLSKW